MFVEDYASKEATVKYLLELGFILGDNEIFDSPGEDAYGLPIIQVTVYQCSKGYYCVDVDWGSYKAPIVWNDPEAALSDTTKEEFVVWLDSHYKGWR